MGQEGVIPGQDGISYDEGFKEKGLFTLERMQLQQHLIFMFEIMKGYDVMRE